MGVGIYEPLVEGKGVYGDMEATNTLIEMIINKSNLNQAFEKVRRNKGVAGVDAKDIEATRQYLKEHGSEIIQLIKEVE